MLWVYAHKFDNLGVPEAAGGDGQRLQSGEPGRDPGSVPGRGEPPGQSWSGLTWGRGSRGGRGWL